MNFITILLILPLLAIIIVLFLIPKYGLFSFSKKAKRDSERIIVEDSLKHIQDCEQNGEISSVYSLSKRLSISTDKTNKLLYKLRDIGLINFMGDAFTLTPEGRSYALRVIRIHRLLEKYLADSTSVKEIDWHAHAEEKEHLITYEEANELASKMGNPLFDPHGDPIPTIDGKLPKVDSIHLSDLKEKEFAQIIHIEDEPKSVYAGIISLGLSIGIVIRIIKISSDIITLESNGKTFSLPVNLAANISVSQLLEPQNFGEVLVPLSSMNIGEEGFVYSLSKSLRGEQRRRIMDFGIVPGTKITPTLQSLGKDPTAYSVRNTTIALRKQQSDLILVKRTKVHV